MNTSKADIIAQLQKDILPLQGFKRSMNSAQPDINLGPLKNAFPNAEFPLGAVHEFFYTGTANAAATGGFVGSILASLMRSGGVAIWISADRTIFPPALRSFGIAPEKIIFIDLQKDSDIIWVTEEALKCNGLAAVVGEIPELSFAISRRLQLAVEQSQVTGFILRRNARSLNTTACITRWKITPLPGMLAGGMPGVGFPCWNVELLKVRNGKPGSWQITCAAGSFRFVQPLIDLILQEPKLKTG